MSSPIALSQTFSRAVTEYDAYAVPQRLIAAKLLCLVREHEPNDAILELGCGTGALSKLLAKRFPSSALVISDFSQKMVHEALQTVPEAVPLVSSFDQLPIASESFGLVASNAALHWGGSLQTAFQQAASVLRSSGQLLISVMTRGSCHELHEARRVSVPSVPPRRSLPTEDECTNACLFAGFAIEETSLVREVQFHPDAEAAVASLHRAGLTGGELSRGSRLLRRGELANLCATYNEAFQMAQGVPVTYEALLLRACKKL